MTLCLEAHSQAGSDPIYLGKFADTIHSVDGDIFVLDDKTIYIQVRIFFYELLRHILIHICQDFSHDGQAPDVFFWADGVIVPYITRTELEPKVPLERFLPREDVVLILPPEIPNVQSIKKLEVWCR